MFQSQTSAQAKTYFRDALSKADYYIEDQEMNGHFHGKIAQRLTLEDAIVTRDTFDKLCDNLHPEHGGNLTPNTVDDRRVGYDISFHAPKSVSILHALGKDDRVLQIFKESIDATMRDIQQDMQTRVRVQHQDFDRDTGEMLWADFVHQTARPVDGQPPDPHLHCHCFTFNVTYDQEEDRYKAGQFHDIKRDMPYHQARFQKRLADGLANIGYKIRRTQNAFEVAVVPQKAIDYFSKRTNLIGQVAKEKGITDPKELDQLGAKTRSKKDKNLSMPELQKVWREGMKREGIDAKTREEKGTLESSMTPEKSVDYAVDHVFTRASVKSERQILCEATKYAVDNPNVSLEELDKAFNADDRIYKIEDGKQRLCTTLVVQDEEKRMVMLARSFRDEVKPIDPDPETKNYKGLNKKQASAVHHVLTSSDRLTMIRGGAGTGKTTLIKNAVSAIEKTNREVFFFAPTANASRDVLRSEGFEKADTVARLLQDTQLQEEIKGQVVWVDEAGMLGAKDTLDILNLVDKQQARLVLSGDPKQHSAVNRGDAMRILQQIGRIPYQNVNVIYRQRVEAYKQAVDAISKGKVSDGFDRLDKMGSIQEIESEKVSDQLKDDYIKAIEDKKSALIISPTNEQASIVTQKIRHGLREQGKLKKREKQYTCYRNLYLTPAQKQDHRIYRPGQMIQTYQNMKGIKRGSKLDVIEAENGTVKLKGSDNQQYQLDISRAHDFDVYVPQEVPLSKGDKIRITRNGYDAEGKRLDNGKILEVTGFEKDGKIKATNAQLKTDNEFLLDKDHGNFDHAYCITSYASQGKTVDRVFIAQPSSTFPASNSKQFYVSVSRGRDSITIYTDKKEDLLHSIQKDGDRMSAHELMDRSSESKTIDLNRLHDYDRHVAKNPQKPLSLDKDKEDYDEPKI